jgi:CheY-like chemotaxis protein
MVDDNDMNLLVFKNLVKQTLVLVDTASSGDECLAMCKNARYDIIFLDHMMPGKDGIETLHELKEMDKSLNPKTPVICLTANAVSGAREEYISEGFDDYLTKPIDSGKLEEMMMTYLPGDKVRHPSEGIKIEFDAVKERDPDLSEDADPKEKEVDIDLLRDQELIDVDAGIYHCGYEDVYKEILYSFYETADDVIDELEGYVENDDIKNYKLRVHTVKSSSWTIGAFLLGDVAESLEKAGKNEDMDYIREHNEELVKEYKKVKTLLERAVLMKL